MYNPIEEKRKFIEAQIQKSFDSGIDVAEEMKLEKAHKDGDHHPTKPWVWVSSANGGKGDWRVANGRTHKKALASTTNTSTGKKADTTTKKRYNLNPDGTPMDMSKIEDDNLRFSIALVKTNIRDLKNKLSQTSNGAVVTRKNLNAKIEDQEGKLAEMEEEMQSRNKKANSSASTQDSKNYPTVNDISEPLDKKGYKVHVTTSGSVEVYKKSDRIAMKNLQVAYDPRTGYINYGPNKNLEKLIGSIFEPKKSDPRDKIAQDAGFKDYAEMKGYQDYVTQKNLLKKKSTKSGMRLLYEKEVAKYEKDHADLISRLSRGKK